jgi:hypothetical protein
MYSASVNATTPQQNRPIVMDDLEVEMASNAMAREAAKVSSPK